MTRVRKIGVGSQIGAGLSGYVASIGQCLVCADLGLPGELHDNHASYIEHWLKLLKDDDRAILTAAAKAEEASTLLLRLGGRISSDHLDEAPDDAALAA